MVIKPHRLRNLLIIGAVIAEAGLGSAGIASAASSGTSSTSSSMTSSSVSTNVPSDPATLTRGPNEILLTGTDLQSATTAATAAEPGATIVRAGLDSGGSVCEVHMQKTDGTYVTVKLGSSFAVTSTEPGFGSGPAAQSANTGVITN